MLAALSGGPDTIVLTRDELRNHMYKLPTVDYQRAFVKWQSRRQHVHHFTLDRSVKILVSNVSEEMEIVLGE